MFGKKKKKKYFRKIASSLQHNRMLFKTNFEFKEIRHWFGVAKAQTINCSVLKERKKNSLFAIDRFFFSLFAMPTNDGNVGIRKFLGLFPRLWIRWFGKYIEVERRFAKFLWNAKVMQLEGGRLFKMRVVKDCEED